MKVFHCDHCGQLLFFENVNCVRCGRALAYVHELLDLVSLDPIQGQGNKWTSKRMSGPLRLCNNYVANNVCNVAIPMDDPHDLCRACRLTRTIPDLSRPSNPRLWYKLEVAKRRLLYTLDQLGLPHDPLAEDPVHGLVFQFLEDEGPDKKVMTGHAAGVITMNIAEADDAERVRRREELNESFRTLLGHFRHEIGHYYWDLLIRDSDRLFLFRECFGDERASYDQALHRHYQGTPVGWQDSFVSAYATMHPWEDWAETWAHYLHMVDTMETAAACGISLQPQHPDEPSLSRVPDPIDEKVPFNRMIEDWTAITYVLTNLNRSLGNADAYPFVLTPKVVEKLRFVHQTIKRGWGGAAAQG